MGDTMKHRSAMITKSWCEVSKNIPLMRGTGRLKQEQNPMYIKLCLPELRRFFSSGFHPALSDIWTLRRDVHFPSGFYPLSPEVCLSEIKAIFVIRISVDVVWNVFGSLPRNWNPNYIRSFSKFVWGASSKMVSKFHPILSEICTVRVLEIRI